MKKALFYVCWGIAICIYAALWAKSGLEEFSEFQRFLGALGIVAVGMVGRAYLTDRKRISSREFIADRISN